MENNELEIDFDQMESNAEEKLKVKNRFEKLSEKVILTAKEKEDALAKANAEANRASNAEKERDFYKGFSQVSSKYPNASQYQEQILERVNKGYEVEEAAIAVLAKEGKLQPITADTQTFRPTNVAGGSAATAMSDTGDKHPDQMSREELRTALLQAEKEGANLLKF